MKIKEITDPTLRWAVIRRLLAKVPDRPAGAGNFVSGGQFSEPSRRKMPGRHAAERAAKQVWNDVVDELGSRPFFDDTLVRVHWIGLYTKRGQDLASNTISYIQEHAGVEHTDEISATAYLREDLAAVTFSRPMIGVILRGRTTYAGAVDLGTQWSVKLKPEDIERQKGSGTRKLPWYEDEGMIADNMTVDEKSWRDHVWGPQYYRTKMPELVVGSWSFDTVLIPQGVMSGAPDDLQRVIEVASSLGCKVVDERGNRYEQGEKMQITEGALRRIIQEILLEGRADFERATSNIRYSSDLDDPLFVEPESKKNIEPARNVKQAWAMAVDKIEEDEYVPGEPPPKISRARRWIQDLHKVTWMPYKGDILGHLYKFLNDTDRRGEIACVISVPGNRMERAGGWSWLGVEVSGRVTLAAEDMNALMTGHIGRLPQWQHALYASSGSPRRPTQFNALLGTKYILGPEDEAKLINSLESSEALVSNWTPKRIVIDYNNATGDLMSDEYQNPGSTIGPFFYAMKNEMKLPIVDTMGNPIDLDKMEADARYMLDPNNV